MIITATNLNKELRELWPKLVDSWPMDKEFWCPTYAELNDALASISWVRVTIRNAVMEKGFDIHLGFKKDVHDCDNFALELQADISRHRLVTKDGVQLEDGLKSWAFGTALCLEVRGQKINHTINICRTSDKGFVFVEPQNNTVWVVDKENDTPYFVEMR